MLARGSRATRPSRLRGPLSIVSTLAVRYPEKSWSRTYDTALGAFTDGSMPRPLPVHGRDGSGPVGRLTSACHSPRLRRNIGFALVPAELTEPGTALTVLHDQHGCLDAAVVPKPHLR